MSPNLKPNRKQNLTEVETQIQNQIITQTLFDFGFGLGLSKIRWALGPKVLESQFMKNEKVKPNQKLKIW